MMHLKEEGENWGGGEDKQEGERPEKKKAASLDIKRDRMNAEERGRG